MISFTGSTEIGRKVSDACAASFKHCCLEMGGKNVIMVLDDGNLELAVDGAIWVTAILYFPINSPTPFTTMAA